MGDPARPDECEPFVFEARRHAWYGRCEYGWTVGRYWSEAGARAGLARHQGTPAHTRCPQLVEEMRDSIAVGWPDPRRALRRVAVAQG
jgi:hypothetical protein